MIVKLQSSRRFVSSCRLYTLQCALDPQSRSSRGPAGMWPGTAARRCSCTGIVIALWAAATRAQGEAADIDINRCLCMSPDNLTSNKKSVKMSHREGCMTDTDE